ncbi:MAG: DUF1385 domain-containing protein [Clostridia bacterium]|nr:DUF1385 domain-containing protein [Clostridia bacterium]
MEGIMMRGPKMTAMAVRNTKGEIVVEEFETTSAKRPAFCRWPIIRGILGYVDAMTLGYKCLMRSAELSGLEDVVEEKPKKKKNKKGSAEPVEETTASQTEEQTSTEKKEDKMPAWMMTLVSVVSVVLGFGLAIVLFMLLPTFLYGLVAPFIEGDNLILNSIWKSGIEGVLKVVLLVGYMAAISLMKDIRRTYMYHGAEHKTIFCYEAGLPLTVENVRKQNRFHPRCGTSFLILMLLVSIFISFFIDPISAAITGEVLPLGLRALVKLALIPIIVGVGYELIKFAGRHDNALTRIISMPGVWLQHLTVFEPDDAMIECAITAVERVIPDDGSDNW